MGIRSFQNKVPRQGERVFVDPASTVIGEVTLGDDSSVWPGAVVRGDMHRIVIGARTSVQDNAVLHITHDSAFNPGGFPLTLGDDVTVGHQAMLHGCTIGDRVMIGMQTMIMDGAVVESDVMLVAGSLVSPGKRLASGWLYRGRPARAVRELTAKEIEFLPYVAGNYVKLKDQYLDEA
ncbi:MAG: gamma carbonic anhydrase family protein [Pseudomonadota bacterium]|nr:gamma carbonic anhydrase family protein [Pseudomonadota bacterium]